MNKPSVSCIIPVYNAERFLAETIESVLAQTYTVDELLLVDDGSTDGSKAIIDRYIGKSATQIRYFHQAQSGPPAARNTGIQAARGEFISFLDSDDLWHTHKTERQIQRFAERAELKISVTHIQNFWMENEHNQGQGIHEHPRAKATVGYAAPTMMARRRVFEHVGLFNATLRFSDSAEWFWRAQQAQIINEVIPDVLVYRRIHSQSHSHSNGKESREEFLKLLHSWRKQERSTAS
jgi:glycosyltransferase involved in cell wall biosynthesis